MSREILDVPSRRVVTLVAHVEPLEPGVSGVDVFGCLFRGGDAASDGKLK